MGERTELGMSSCVHRKQGFFQSVYVDDIKMAGKKAEYGSHVEEIDEKNVDLDEPTSFLDHVYWGCTQRECKPNETVIEHYKKKTFE